jgi:hypothetical protein
MRKRRRVLLLLGFLSSLACLGFVGANWALHLRMTPGVNVENFRRLTLGMTEAEVEQILGRPGEFEPQSPHWKQWNENGTFISVGFGNQDGSLNCATANVSVPGSGRSLLVIPEQSRIDRIRRLFGF